MEIDEGALLLELSDRKTRDAAYSRLIKWTQEPLYRHIRRMGIEHQIADDILQETYIKVWRYIDSFRGDSALRTWIFKIATNETLSHLRKAKLRKTGDLPDHTPASQSEGLMPPEEIEAQLSAALSTLPDKQRLVFNMRYYDDLTYEEIAKITTTSVGALKASYFHAVRKIESFLKS